MSAGLRPWLRDALLQRWWRWCKAITMCDDSVIGAGSVVVSDIPAGSIAAGNPARVPRGLDEA
jgi:hypothetical protein